MSSKRIGIYCTSRSLGGLELNTLRLAQWLEERGWEVHLLLQSGVPMAVRGAELGLRITTLPDKKGLAGRAFLKALQDWVQQCGLPALIIPYNKDLSLVALYKRLFNRRIRLIYQQHMQVGVSKRDPVHTLRYAALDAWISPLRYLKEETMAKTRVPASKIQVVPLGLDPAPFLNSPWTRATARAAFNLPDGPELIGVLGRIDPKKGQDLVIRGIHRLQETYGHDYHLLLVGDATLNEGDAFSRSLKALVQELGITERVHFRGFQPDIMQFFRAIDLFAMPSHGETYGMVTLEAMAAGVPVVGTGRDGTRELLQNGKFGFLFPKDDTDAFCRSVIAWKEKQDKADWLEAARREVLANYSKDEMIRGLEALLISLID